MARNWIGKNSRRKRVLIGESLSKGQWQVILVTIIIVVYVAAWALIWQFGYNLDFDKWHSGFLLGALPALLTAAGGLYLYKRKYPSPRISGWIYIILIAGSGAIPGVTYLLAPNLFTLVPGTGPGPSIITTENATLSVQVRGVGAEMRALTEMQLFQAIDLFNFSSWTQIDLSGLTNFSDFYHDGWLNADFFNYNLSKIDLVNVSETYMARVRPWWLLHEWINGNWSAPSWWSLGRSLELANMLKPNTTFPLIEENETSPSWGRIDSGSNIIQFISEPYTLFGSIMNPNTFASWDSADGAYPDNTTANWKIVYNPPTNESQRGYMQTYDWETARWYGAWLIASSNESQNIYRAYNNSANTTRLNWFNITTIGENYNGAILNNSIVSDTIYDAAMLLPTFNWQYTFNADIHIWNGTAGIHWYLGFGYEDNIQLIRKIA